MKILLLLAPALLLSTGAVAKVTYEDAVNSTKEYYQANAAVHNPPQDKGLSAAEEQEELAGGNEMGKWKSENKTGSTTARVPLKSGDYYDSKVKAELERSDCVKGMKGYVADRYKPSSNANYQTRYHLFTCQ